VAAVLAAAALLAAAPPSDPVGVYAIVDRVVVAPDTINPATIQIWGTFAVSDQKAGDHYLPAAKGYLYYRLNASNTRASQAEWADLRRVAGTKTVVGFSAKWQRNTPGRSRCATEAVGNADEYPIQSGMGVVRLPDTRHTGGPIAKELLSAKVPDAPCGKAR
jgi:hypothetical protein